MDSQSVLRQLRGNRDLCNIALSHCTNIHHSHCIFGYLFLFVTA